MQGENEAMEIRSVQRSKRERLSNSVRSGKETGPDWAMCQSHFF